MGVLLTTLPKERVTEVVDTENQPTLKLCASTANFIGGGQYKEECISKWKSTNMQIVWDVQFTHAGRVNFTLNLANNRLNAGAIIRVQIGTAKSSGKTFFSGGWKNFELMPMGSVTITEPGTYTVTLQAVELNNLSAGLLSYVILSGPGVEGAAENEISPLTGYVVMMWNNGDGSNWAYNAVKVVEDFNGTAYVACSFLDGQLILLSDPETAQKHVIFIVYSAEHSVELEGSEKSCVSKQVLPTLVQKQKQVSSRISVENSGHYSYYKYAWEIQQTYHFLIKAEILNQSVQYSAFFYLNETQQWKKLAVYRVRHAKPELLKGLNCRIQAFCERSGRFTRKAIFGPAWCRRSGNDWVQVKRFSVVAEDAESRAVPTSVDTDKVLLTTWGKIQVEAGTTNVQCGGSKLPSLLEVLPE